MRYIADVLSETSSTNTLKIESLTFSTKAGDKFEFNNLDISTDSRMIDVLLGIIISEGQR